MTDLQVQNWALQYSRLFFLGGLGSDGIITRTCTLTHVLKIDPSFFVTRGLWIPHDVTYHKCTCLINYALASLTLHTHSLMPAHAHLLTRAHMAGERGENELVHASVLPFNTRQYVSASVFPLAKSRFFQPSF